jgi:hypothetical protein
VFVLAWSAWAPAAEEVCVCDACREVRGEKVE